jgi:hypothetical protein
MATKSTDASATAQREDNWRGLNTEYTELQPLLSGVHSVMRVKLVLAG